MGASAEGSPGSPELIVVGPYIRSPPGGFTPSVTFSNAACRCCFVHNDSAGQLAIPPFMSTGSPCLLPSPKYWLSKRSAVSSSANSTAMSQPGASRSGLGGVHPPLLGGSAPPLARTSAQNSGKAPRIDPAMLLFLALLLLGVSTAHDVDVIVVGAGQAGMAAARRLSQRGMTVQVLEVHPLQCAQ
jgi:hypothetical protein